MPHPAVISRTRDALSGARRASEAFRASAGSNAAEQITHLQAQNTHLLDALTSLAARVDALEHKRR